MTPSDLPGEDDVKHALFHILSLNPKGVTAKDAYRILAERFGLTSADTQTKMRSETREIHWHNRVRWARNDLRKRGHLDENAPRGVWKLSQSGIARARMLDEIEI